MPRVVTKEYREHLAERQALREASAEYGKLRDAAIADVSERFGFASAGKSDNGPYGPGTDRSWFLDLAYSVGDPRTMPLPPNLVGSAEAAQERLQRVHGGIERRDLSTTVTAGGNFVPTGSPPSYVADAFAASARAASVMSDVLPYRPLPPTGMALKTPRVTTSATVAIQATENSGVSETDIVESLVTNPIGTVAGQQDLSQQLYDRAEPAMGDVVLAEELGRALGEAFDAQVLAGTGASGQMLGLRAVTGIVANTYVDATSTQAEAWPVLMKTYADVANALGRSPNAILMKPRRNAWFYTWRDAATTGPAVLRYPADVVEVPAIAANYGAGTEDEIYVIAADELPVFSSEPVFRVSFDLAGSSTLTARVTAYQYVSALFTRRPEAIGKLSGSGLIAPVFA
jgi:hypothetical protein